MRVFKDKRLQEQFDRDGYVKISLADAKTVQYLSTLYKEVQPLSYKGFSSTIYNPDVDLKVKTSQKIFEVLDGVVKEQLENFRPLGCSFLCKTSGQESFLPVHQDWTIVDESRFASITVWMPLVNTNEKNGQLKVLPGSHRFTDVLRSPTLPGVFQNIKDDVYARMITLPVKAGEAVVFNHALLHASPPNLSGSDRVVATYGLVPAEAELHFYHRKNGSVEKYKIKDDFFLTYNNIGSAPGFAEKVEEFTYQWKEWNHADFDAAAQKQKQAKSENMKRLFKDDKIQEFYNKNGYAKFPVLDEADVQVLYDFYFTQGLKDRSGSGFSMSMEDDDKEKVARIRTKIYEVALPKAMQHFANAQTIAGSYVVKDPNPVCIVPPHQDWTFADNEGEYYSVTCWIPLVDTTLENGAMGVIKCSHLMLNNLRASPSPQIPTPLMHHQFSLFPYLEMIEMKAGEALVFDHRTFHASTPNITQKPRIAVGLGFTQQDAVICHYTMKQNGKMDTLLKYYVDDAFLLKFDNSLISRMYDKNEPITGYEVAAEIPFECHQPSLEELVAMVTQAGNPLNTELAAYMAKLFGNNVMQPESTKAGEPVVAEPVAVEPAQPVKHQNGKKNAYTPMNILREIKYRLVGSKPNDFPTFGRSRMFVPNCS